VTETLIEGIFHKDNIVHVGALLYLSGFLFRNQILLRGLIILGDIVYIAYFFLAPATPLWGAIFWSGLFMAVNCWMIGVILAETMHFRLTATERQLFDALKDLTPGQFRQLLKLAREGTAEAPMVITEEGKALDSLYFVLSGTIAIEKRGARAMIDAGTFIGEIAFLLDRPATATVTLQRGCHYFLWPSAALKTLMEAKPALGSALTAAMNRNLAMKVAKSELGGRPVEAAGVG
jgi:hypothetical protein